MQAAEPPSSQFIGPFKAEHRLRPQLPKRPPTANRPINAVHRRAGVKLRHHNALAGGLLRALITMLVRQ